MATKHWIFSPVSHCCRLLSLYVSPACFWWRNVYRNIQCNCDKEEAPTHQLIKMCDLASIIVLSLSHKLTSLYMWSQQASLCAFMCTTLVHLWSCAWDSSCCTSFNNVLPHFLSATQQMLPQCYYRFLYHSFTLISQWKSNFSIDYVE